MNKKIAHLILFIGDIFCLWVIWMGYHELQRILAEIHNHIEAIHYGNRISFFLVAGGGPILHFVTVIEYFRPTLINKFYKILNWGALILVGGLIVGGIVGSYYLTYCFESAGYIYCRKASGISAVYRSVIYTINDKVCEEVAATQRRRF